MTALDKFIANFPSKFDAGLITSPANRYYYTGINTSAGVVILTKDKGYFLVDSRYIEVAQKLVTHMDVRLFTGKPQDMVAEILKSHNAKVVGCETSSLSVVEFAKYQSAIAPIELSKCDGFEDAILNQRMIKTDAERALIAECQRITDDAFSYILPRIEKGRKEKELAWELEVYMRTHGAEGLAFQCITLSGPNSAMPHGVPSDREIQHGDALKLDFGAKIGNQVSDMTRTVFVGACSDKQKLVYETVLNAQLAALEIIRPGVIGEDVDAAARDYIKNAGFGGFFGHGLGHGIAVPRPSFSPGCKIALEPGMSLSVEPGIYLPGEFGVRIEDIIIVEENGYYNFTKTAKDLLII